jgi:hypothetical protein
MKIYEFSVIASGLDPSADNFEARFYDAGCDDATISFQKGHTIVDFAREAESADAAISSAVEAVLAAGAVVDRVEPDPLVNLAEIAARTGMSRAAMTQYSKGQRASGFPAPVARVYVGQPIMGMVQCGAVAFQAQQIESGSGHRGGSNSPSKRSYSLRRDQYWTASERARACL